MNSVWSEVSTVGKDAMHSCISVQMSWKNFFCLTLYTHTRMYYNFKYRYTVLSSGLSHCQGTLPTLNHFMAIFLLK